MMAKERMFSGGTKIRVFLNSESAFYIFGNYNVIFPIKIREESAGDYFNENWLSTELDGDAYYKAREAIISIQKKY